ncbi:monocarboxylate transporter 12-like [Mytilus edulis]|uniref:monocarboxylate transporter 12-like n=1 Tax=Mytilus edulis TaxID=6550 RepID=UPI0039F047B8
MVQKYNDQQNKDLDQGWAWVIMIAATGIIMINAILLYATGVLHVALLEKFEEDNAYTSLIGSIYSSLFSFAGPFSSIVINAFSCRVAVMLGGVVILVGYGLSFFAAVNLNYLLVTYGIVAGIGVGLSTIPAITVIVYFFNKKYGVAIGIVTSGAGIGTFITGPLVQYLIMEYGLEGTFLLLAGLGGNVIVMGALVFPSDLEHKHKREAKLNYSKETTTKQHCCMNFDIENILHFDIFLDKTFMCCCVQYCLWSMAFSILMLHLINYAIIQGTSNEAAAFLMIYVGIGSTIGRLISGLSVGYNGLDPVLLNFGCNGILALATACFPLYSDKYVGQVIFAVIFGLYSGGLSTMISPLCMDLLGAKKVASGIGTLFFIGGIGYLAGPPVAGAILDYRGEYKESLYLCGCLFLLSAIFTLVSSLFRSQPTEHEVTLSLGNLKDSNFKIFDEKLLNNLNVSVEVLPDQTAICNREKAVHQYFVADDKTNEQTPLTTYCAT